MTDSSSCSNGAVKLWSAYDSTPANEGLVLVCKNGTWHPVSHSSSCYAAEIACTAAGYTQLECEFKKSSL